MKSKLENILKNNGIGKHQMFKLGMYTILA